MPVEKDLKMKKNSKKIGEKISYFLAYNKHPPATHECPLKISAQLILPFGRLYATFIYTNVLFYYIDFAIETFVSPPQKNGDTFFNV